MTMNCVGCDRLIEVEEKERHYFICKDAPFLLPAELWQQLPLYRKFEQEFEDLCLEEDKNPHLYDNMELGDDTFAYIPCTGCPSFYEHLRGHCIFTNFNVKNFEDVAGYLRDKVMHDYKQFVDLAEENYLTKAQEWHAGLVKHSPCCQHNRDISLDLLHLVEKIPEIAAARKQRMIKDKQASLDKDFKIGVAITRMRNKRFLLEEVESHFLNPELLEVLNAEEEFPL